MERLIALAAAAASPPVCGAASAAVFTSVNCKPGDIHFCVDGNAEAPGVHDYITGSFTNTLKDTATAIKDTFSFNTDKNGVGSRLVHSQKATAAASPTADW